MNFALTIRPPAEADIEEAFRYYEHCRPQLGSDFILCIEESLTKISRQPTLYKTIHKDIRRTFIKRFPYGIFYTLERQHIIVLAVLHSRKNPQHWQTRK